MQAAEAAFVCVATPLRVSDFGKGVVEEIGFLHQEME